MMTAEVPTVKITLVGDAAVGKTSILTAYDKKEFSEEYEVTVYNTNAKEIVLDEQTFYVEFFDTAGQEDYDKLRPICYNETTCFIVCFAINSLTSYMNVEDKWSREIKHFERNTRFILVGTKLDLRSNDGLSKVITKEKGQQLAKKINAHCYMECSSKLHVGIEDLIDTAILINQTCLQKCKRCLCVTL